MMDYVSMMKALYECDECMNADYEDVVWRWCSNSTGDDRDVIAFLHRTAQ